MLPSNLTLGELGESVGVHWSGQAAPSFQKCSGCGGSWQGRMGMMMMMEMCPGGSNPTPPALCAPEALLEGISSAPTVALKPPPITCREKRALVPLPGDTPAAGDTGTGDHGQSAPGVPELGLLLGATQLWGWGRGGQKPLRDARGWRMMARRPLSAAGGDWVTRGMAGGWHCGHACATAGAQVSGT